MATLNEDDAKATSVALASVPVPMVAKVHGLAPKIESAARATLVWLNAAHKLLNDVRGELSILVLLRDAKALPDTLLRTGGGAPDEELVFDAAESEYVDEAATLITGQEGLLQGVPDTPSMRTATVTSSLDFYLRQLHGIKSLTVEEERQLVIAAQAGHANAINQLVSRHLRIVPAIARQFIGRGLPLEDLIEEGNLGLYRAVPRFDLALGYRFASYARWWVKNEIRTAVLNQGRLIRLPVHVFRALSRVRKQLDAAGHAMPYAVRGVARAPLAEGADDALRLTLVEAQELLRLTELPMSLDMPVEADGPTTLVDTLESERDTAPDSRMQHEQRSRLLTQALDRLTATEREVIVRRYGFASGEPETLEAIGRTLRLTAERVRQIQKQALLHIQHDMSQRGLSLDELL